VLDFRDTWKFFDPGVYPNGVEGGVKLTRMIYSDPVGHVDNFSHLQPPPNVAGPLKELTVWSQNYEEFYHGSTHVISATQSTSPPSGGPAQSGQITGDATHDYPTTVYFLDLSYNGPITDVQVKRDKDIATAYSPWIPTEIAFKLAASDTWWHGGNSGGGTTVPWLGTDPTELPDDVKIFSYSGNVLASVKSMGVYEYYGKTAESVIFGFRLYDSFFPAGALVNIKSGKCMDVRDLTAGTRPTIYSCFSGSPAGQIWTYNTNTKQVTIGDLCLRATGTTYGSAVEIDVCTDAKNQQWEFVPSANGLSGIIKSVESGLALDVSQGGTADRTPIVLWYPHGDTNQQWTVTSPLTGEIHGVASGRCLDVKSDDMTNGTPVQIYDCNGTAAQAWTYNESTHTLSVHNGTKCLDAGAQTSGTALRIWDCSGGANQQWSFDTSQHVVLSNGLVLNVKDGGMTNGSPVILWNYTSGPQQKWTRPSRLGRHVHATYAGKCLDVPSLASGERAQIYDCLPSPSSRQDWTYHPLTQRITAHGDGTEHCLSISAAAVIITDCLNDPNQLWTLEDNGIGGTIISTPSMDTDSPLCMTLPGTGIVTASETKVEVQACPTSGQPANPNQQWIWP